MAALGELAAVFRIEESVEIGAVEDQAGQIQAESVDQSLAQGLADGLDSIFEQLDVVPETLGGKLLPGASQPTKQGGEPNQAGIRNLLGESGSG